MALAMKFDIKFFDVVMLYPVLEINWYMLSIVSKDYKQMLHSPKYKNQLVI